MDDATRAVIRRLYFVDRWPVDTIADELGLEMWTVHRALVIPGEDAAAVDSEPTTVATEAVEPEPKESDL